MIFYGAPIKVDYDPRLKNTKINAIDPDGISTYWLALSEAYYNHLLKQLREFQTELNLNDFATVQLIQKTAAAIHPNDPAHQALLEWFLLTRSRFFSEDCLPGKSGFRAFTIAANPLWRTSC